MSLPWFPFYVDDFLASPKVRRMEAREVGTYLLLMLEQWQSGEVVGTPDELARLTNSTPEIVEKVLEGCFEKVGKGWVNRRLQGIAKDQDGRQAKASAAAKARWDKASNADAMRTHERSECYPEPEPEPYPEPESKTPSGEKRARRKKATPLPADWQPTESHRKRAKEEGVNCDREAEKFRAHAEANDRRQASWNAAFTTWLLNAKDFQPRGHHPTEGDTKHWEREIERFRDFGKPKPGLERLSVDVPRTA